MYYIAYYIAFYRVYSVQSGIYQQYTTSIPTDEFCIEMLHFVDFERHIEKLEQSRGGRDSLRNTPATNQIERQRIVDEHSPRGIYLLHLLSAPSLDTLEWSAERQIVVIVDSSPQTICDGDRSRLSEHFHTECCRRQLVNLEKVHDILGIVSFNLGQARDVLKEHIRRVAEL